MRTQVEEARKALEIKIEEIRRQFERDTQFGYRDHKAGCYDKWYRTYREDGGRAYDAAWNDAQLADPKSAEEIQFIEA